MTLEKMFAVSTMILAILLIFSLWYSELGQLFKSLRGFIRRALSFDNYLETVKYVNHSCPSCNTEDPTGKMIMYDGNELVLCQECNHILECNSHSFVKVTKQPDVFKKGYNITLLKELDFTDAQIARILEE